MSDLKTRVFNVNLRGDGAPSLLCSSGRYFTSFMSGLKLFVLQQNLRRDVIHSTNYSLCDL